ncbi:MAG: 50S ribosomal protein L1 [Kiritimatiellae bacterium]|nr:50S ribosomal protein L1 [Kiritimatiellia bacterium]
MAKHGKKYFSVIKKLESKVDYGIEDALRFLKENSTAKFDESAEIAFRLGVDSTKSDQMVRGTVSLPHGTGKEVRVIVFASGPAADTAREAGATEVGFEDLIQKVKEGWTDFDVAVATPEAMKEVRKLGKVLGPRGLMPNPKTGTVTDDTANAVKQFKGGRVEFKMDRNGNVMLLFGKLSFSIEALTENCHVVIDAVNMAKPSAAKGVFIKTCTLTSTMGPGLALNIKTIAA